MLLLTPACVWQMSNEIISNTIPSLLRKLCRWRMNYEFYLLRATGVRSLRLRAWKITFYALLKRSVIRGGAREQSGAQILKKICLMNVLSVFAPSPCRRLPLRVFRLKFITVIHARPGVMNSSVPFGIRSLSRSQRRIGLTFSLGRN